MSSRTNDGHSWNDPEQLKSMSVLEEVQTKRTVEIQKVTKFTGYC